jgi:hypothetical protein
VFTLRVSKLPTYCSNDTTRIILIRSSPALSTGALRIMRRQVPNPVSNEMGHPWRLQVILCRHWPNNLGNIESRTVPMGLTSAYSFSGKLIIFMERIAACASLILGFLLSAITPTKDTWLPPPFFLATLFQSWPCSVLAAFLPRPLCRVILQATPA